MRWATPVFLLVTLLTVFLPTLAFDFTTYDEYGQIYANPLVRSLSPAGVARMFSRFSIASYYPVRLLSFAIDYAVWGLHPAGYHLTNVTVHLLNASLLWLLLIRLAAGSRAGQGGAAPAERRAGRWLLLVVSGGTAVFGLHPIVAEPVAWVGGREELLAVLFLLGAVHAHLSADAAAGRRVWLWRGLSWLFGLLACLSNVVAAVAPLWIAATDLVTTRRRTLRRLAARTGVFWLLAAGTIVLKLARADPSRAGVDCALPQRALLILDTYCRNVLTVVWPGRLFLLYPNRVPEHVLEPRVWFGALFACGTLAALHAARRRPLLCMGLAWFAAGLLPSAQVVPHHIFRADRFLYLPMVGLGVATTACLRRLRDRLPFGMVAAGCALLLVILGVRTSAQVQVWRNSETLFEHTLRENPGAYQAHSNLGLYLLGHRRVDEAVTHYSMALAIKNDMPDGYFGLASALVVQGRLQDAIPLFSEALKIDPNLHDVHVNLGVTYVKLGEIEKGVAQYSKALAIRPDSLEAHMNLGTAFSIAGRYDEAIAHASAALALNPRFSAALEKLGALYSKQGRADEAIRHYSAALRLNPGNPELRRQIEALRQRRGEKVPAD
ncbi:MAG: tetratricopeptide repeat protein [Kiritimatiellae bacterium]|nr:tetratricopeptide repeat protein [Kiritimatiellia bacterium]